MQQSSPQWALGISNTDVHTPHLAQLCSKDSLTCLADPSLPPPPSSLLTHKNFTPTPHALGCDDCAPRTITTQKGLPSPNLATMHQTSTRCASDTKTTQKTEQTTPPEKNKRVHFPHKECLFHTNERSTRPCNKAPPSGHLEFQAQTFTHPTLHNCAPRTL